MLRGIVVQNAIQDIFLPRLIAAVPVFHRKNGSCTRSRNGIETYSILKYAAVYTQLPRTGDTSHLGSNVTSELKCCSRS